MYSWITYKCCICLLGWLNLFLPKYFHACVAKHLIRNIVILQKWPLYCSIIFVFLKQCFENLNNSLEWWGTSGTGRISLSSPKKREEFITRIAHTHFHPYVMWQYCLKAMSMVFTMYFMRLGFNDDGVELVNKLAVQMCGQFMHKKISCLVKLYPSILVRPKLYRLDWLRHPCQSECVTCNIGEKSNGDKCWLVLLHIYIN